MPVMEDVHFKRHRQWPSLGVHTLAPAELIAVAWAGWARYARSNCTTGELEEEVCTKISDWWAHRISFSQADVHKGVLLVAITACQTHWCILTEECACRKGRLCPLCRVARDVLNPQAVIVIAEHYEGNRSIYWRTATLVECARALALLEA